MCSTCLACNVTHVFRVGLRVFRVGLRVLAGPVIGHL